MNTATRDSARPQRERDGPAAVHIDIGRIMARLTFDGATRTGSGDATIKFITGPLNGSPLFELPQTITAAWLDGQPVTVGRVSTPHRQDGPHVLDCVLAASSPHTLRVAYTLSPTPQSMAGSCRPGMVWSRGPRLAFNCGCIDRGTGHALDAWIPANPILDWFELNLELQVLNTPIVHRPVTNGTVTVLGFNHWSVSFPTRSTALSPLVALRPAEMAAGPDDAGLGAMVALTPRPGPAELRI